MKIFENYSSLREEFEARAKEHEKNSSEKDAEKFYEQNREGLKKIISKIKETKFPKSFKEFIDFFIDGIDKIIDRLIDAITLKRVDNKTIIIIAYLAYLISPIDIVPDAIPVAGWIDDVIMFKCLIDYLNKKDN